MPDLIMDIETAPIAFDEAAQFMPDFEAPGNIKDPAKVAAAIDEKRAAWMDKLALSALTGRVLCIGVMDTGSDEVETMEGDEKAMLEGFWLRAKSCVGQGGRLIGFNIDRFDLPHLVRRSFLHGVDVPPSIYRNYRFSATVDLMRLWQCDDREARVSLDTLSRYLGVGSKNGSGKDFGALYASNREAALEYLANDLRLTARCAERMGVIDTF